ncbi:unnamed protein product [Cyprideis torosa]|uniref:Uncharacterized protein n=1 Tax=Cyprideis torosa TaxID=163714 RepID=A0A7R8WBY7_9CRUS|nr:unnamed protein product [Cyprideis torosa]CAG0892834.1 unnamed protein product [Cyprideis torosa]
MAQGNMKVKNRDKVPPKKKHVSKIPKKGPKPLPGKKSKQKQSQSAQIHRAISKAINARNEDMVKAQASHTDGRSFQLLTPSSSSAASSSVSLLKKAPVYFPVDSPEEPSVSSPGRGSNGGRGLSSSSSSPCPTASPILLVLLLAAFSVGFLLALLIALVLQASPLADPQTNNFYCSDEFLKASGFDNPLVGYDPASLRNVLSIRTAVLVFSETENFKLRSVLRRTWLSDVQRRQRTSEGELMPPIGQFWFVVEVEDILSRISSLPIPRSPRNKSFDITQQESVRDFSPRETAERIYAQLFKEKRQNSSTVLPEVEGTVAKQLLLEYQQYRDILFVGPRESSLAVAIDYLDAHVDASFVLKVPDSSFVNFKALSQRLSVLSADVADHVFLASFGEPLENLMSSSSNTIHCDQTIALSQHNPRAWVISGQLLKKVSQIRKKFSTSHTLINCQTNEGFTLMSWIAPFHVHRIHERNIRLNDSLHICSEDDLITAPLTAAQIERRHRNLKVKMRQCVHRN